MTREQPPDLSRCHDHDVQLVQDEHGSPNYCPCCELGLDARPNDDVPGSTDQAAVRSPIRKSTIRELIPLMREYLEDRQGEDYELWYTHDRYSGTLPAGYSEQERFVPVLRYNYGIRTKGMDNDHDARTTIETLSEEGYGD